MGILLEFVIGNEAHWYVSPEWWLAAFALVTLIVVIVQTRATAKAAKAASDAASAARLSVDAADRQIIAMEGQTRALIASERAWLVGTIEDLVIRESAIENRVTVLAQCTIRNLGKTPARITASEASVLMLDSAKSLSSLGWIPNFTNGSRITPIPEFIGGLEVRKVPVACDFEGVWMGTLLVFYGVIRYTHVLSDTDVQTTFGYTIDRNHRFERLPSEFSEYNKST